MDNSSSASHPETRRDRRMQRQRQAIMDGAARLFAEKGYASTTTKDIAGAADIGESTLYGYFSSKRDILIAIVTNHADSIDSMLEKAPKIDSRESASVFVDQLLEIILVNAEYTRALIGEAWINDDVLNRYIVERGSKLMGLITGFIRQETRLGLLRPVDPGIAARFVLAAVLGIILPTLRGTAPVPLPEERRELSKTIVSLIIDGLIQPGA